MRSALALIMMAACAPPERDSRGQTPVLQFSPAELNAGKIEYQTSFILVGMLQNLTPDVILLDSVDVSCGCTIPGELPERLDPWEMLPLTVRVHAARRGAWSTAVFVQGHAQGTSARKMASLNINVFVPGDIVCEPPRLILDGGEDKLLRIHHRVGDMEDEMRVESIDAPDCLRIIHLGRSERASEAGGRVVTEEYSVGLSSVDAFAVSEGLIAIITSVPDIGAVEVPVVIR